MPPPIGGDRPAGRPQVRRRAAGIRPQPLARPRRPRPSARGRRRMQPSTPPPGPGPAAPAPRRCPAGRASCPRASGRRARRARGPGPGRGVAAAADARGRAGFDPPDPVGRRVTAASTWPAPSASRCSPPCRAGVVVRRPGRRARRRGGRPRRHPDDVRAGRPPRSAVGDVVAGGQPIGVLAARRLALLPARLPALGLADAATTTSTRCCWSAPGRSCCCRCGGPALPLGVPPLVASLWRPASARCTATAVAGLAAARRPPGRYVRRSRWSVRPAGAPGGRPGAAGRW